MELCNPSRHEICIMTNVKELKFTLRCNDVSEMSFRVYKTMNEVDFPEYGLVRKMRMIHVDGMGYFVIQEVSEIFEGEVPYKDVTLYSAEYMLNYKPVNLALTTMVDGGTTVFAKSYKFYDKDYPKDTLMYRLFAGADFKDWTFDYDSIDESLMGKYRSFDDSGDGLYGFLQNYVSTSYECVFTYDIENYVVSVHKKDDLIRPTDITLSMDNLMKQANLKELSDEITTVLAVKGSDKLSLSKVNPTGTNNIYNFDYYLNEEWLGDDFYVSSVKYDENGNVMYDAFGKPQMTTMLFTEHVKLWEEKIKKIVMDASTEGSYGWLLTRYTYLNSQYVIMNTYHTQAEYIYNYCTEAISTYKEETKEQKRSIWGSILFGVGLAVLAVAGVALAAATGGLSVGATVGALATGSAAALSTAVGATGVVESLAVVGATTLFTTGVSTAFSGLFQLGKLAYQTNITKEQMQKYQQVAQDNMNRYKSGGGYVYNLTPETLTKLVAGTNKEFAVEEPIFWISNVYDDSDTSSIYQKRPKESNVKDTVPQNYCLDVLNRKLDYIQNKLDKYVQIYAYKNWFSEKEQEVLQPFLIQSEYSDESFTATDDIDIETATDTTKYITTNQGTMTIEEYRCATDGYMIRYICDGNTTDYEATPVAFSENTFRIWLTSYTKWASYKNNLPAIRGHFYMVYDGTNWTISDSDSGSIINVVYGAFPNQCGVTQNTYDGKYKYTSKVGDYIILNLYSDKIKIIDTLTVATQLAQQGYEALDDCSQPAFSFDITSNNFLFLPEYKQWTEEIGFDGDGLTLGSMINVVYVDDQILNPFVQEISYEYDNPDSLSFTFGSKFNLGTSEYTLGKIFSNNTSTVQRVQRALIGTSTTNGSGSSEARNNSSAIASTNNAIDDITRRGGLLDEALLQQARKLTEQFEKRIAEENTNLDQTIRADIGAMKNELQNSIISKTNGVKDLMDANMNAFSTTISGGLGLYVTPITDSTGTKYCFHDGTTMANSKTYYYFTGAGFGFVTYNTAGVLNVNNIGYCTDWRGIDRSGSMVMNEITSKKITTDQFTANSINGDRITTNTILGDKIVVNTITGKRIRAESIYASNLREDAWCKLLWTNTSPTAAKSEFTIYPDNLSNYTAAMIYCKNGNASTLVLSGNASTMVSMAFGAGSDYTDFGHLTGHVTSGGVYDSYAMREVAFNIDQNGRGYLQFSQNKVLQFGKATGSKGDGVFNDYVEVQVIPTYTSRNSFNIPVYVYGLRFGVRARDEDRTD